MPTILIVDDLAANREVLATIVRFKGHEVIQAADGAEGLALALSATPALIITDVLMPVMDGYELVRQLRLHAATRDIPVVFYTAHYSEREARDLALSSGVADVLTKPIEPEVVVRLIARVLAGLASGPSPRDILPGSDFDREHLRLVTDKLAAQVDEVHAANVRLRALVNIGLELASERDAGRLLEAVCLSARDLFAASYVTLGIVGRKTQTVERVVSAGVDATGWFVEGSGPPGLLGTVVAERRTVRGTHADGDPARLGLPAAHAPIPAYLVAPIASPAYIYGWFCLAATDGRAFSDDDEQLVRALSGQVGRIYENGHFYAMAQKRAEALQAEVVRRQQVEVELRHQHTRAQQYLDGAEVMLLALDAAGHVTLANRYACGLLEWTADDLIGRDWVATCVPERLHGLARRHLSQTCTGDVCALDYEVVTRSGAERRIAWRTTLLRDEQGHVTGRLNSGTDVTERHRAIEALRVADDRMRFALESANIGIWDMDFASGHIEWSDIVARHYGVAPASFTGRYGDFIERVHPDDREATRASIAAARAAGHDFRVQHRSIWPDGSVHWIEGTGRAIVGADGMPTRVVGITIDATERRQLEAQYQQAQKMEAMGRLAGGVAHDFNNLLTAILGYCELLSDEYDESDPRRHDIAQIQKAGIRASGLTQQLLAFSRKQIIAPTVLDLNALVADLQALLGRVIGEDVAVRLRLGAAVPLVLADRGQLEQVLMNLAVNARDAMPRGGTLTIGTAAVDVPHDPAALEGAPSGPFAVLTVTDTGTGMSEHVRARIFEPFFTTKELGKGTGLGLATVDGVVSRNGGHIEVDTEVGHGTTFRVYLPATTGVAHTPAPPVLPMRPLTVQTVLVVEDAAPLRALVARLLERLGYRARLAANAEEAIALFLQHDDIDLVLTDVVMPLTSGPDLVAQLLEIRPATHVLYMSGYTEDAIVHHGVLKPGVTLLHKPFSSERLDAAIRDAVRGGADMDADA